MSKKCFVSSKIRAKKVKGERMTNSQIAKYLTKKTRPRMIRTKPAIKPKITRKTVLNIVLAFSAILKMLPNTSSCTVLKMVEKAL